MEAQFFGHLRADHVEGKWWKLMEPLGFYSAKYDVTVCTPKDFVLDFASVPRLPFAYLIAGNTGNWEATIHDVIYRYGLLSRWKGDQIFCEGGRVRSNMRENQEMLYRYGRWVRTTAMTSMVVALGWTSYASVEGCLDYRHKKTCGRNCEECDNYYPKWKYCAIPGYVENIIELHS